MLHEVRIGSSKLDEEGSSGISIMALKWMDRLTVNRKKDLQESSSHHNLCVLTNRDARIITITGVTVERIALSSGMCQSYALLLNPSGPPTGVKPSNTMPLIVSNATVSSACRIYALTGLEDHSATASLCCFYVQVSR